LGKAITGAHAAKAKNSLFVTAAIKAAVLRQLSLTPLKPKQFISVAVSSQRMAFCVTEATTLFEAFIENIVIV
jgi:D-aminopeptidase